ncbi:MAG: hypothetical protein DMG61_15510 [Acidobacteria bacterium]|nr:MAG: hypothetical protein DMG61_15510 [Acidobacteriota bacterium]
MLTEDDVRRLLLQKTETKNLDYKQTCNWANASSDEKCELVKDILAMANTQDGGQIVFGVEDRTFNLVGMTDAEFQSFDPTRVNDFVRRYSDPPFACTVYKFVMEGLNSIVIEVPEFQEVPIICKTDAHSSNNPRRLILKKSGLYVRTDKPSSELVSNADEIRDIIGRASRKKREELVRTIEALVTGVPVHPRREAREQYETEMRDADDFFARSLPANFTSDGHWEVVAYPTDYVEDRFNDHQRLADAIRDSAVALRGWTFPHTDREKAANFLKGCQSSTVWSRYIEAYRAYFSGLFVWKGAFRENALGEGAKVLSFISTIYSLTEFFQFFKRYYGRIPDMAGLHAGIRLTDTAGRALASLDPRVELDGEYISREPGVLLQRDVSFAELQSDSDQIARVLAKRLFALFNWNNISDEIIVAWQQRLLTRTY